MLEANVAATNDPPVQQATGSPEQSQAVRTTAKQPSADTQPGNPSLRGLKRESLAGYLEWRRADAFIVDGQLVTWNAATRFHLGKISLPDSIPLGYEVNATGARLPDGRFLATDLWAKPNGIAAFEREVKTATEQVERSWLTEGFAFAVGNGGTQRTGRIIESGSDVERVRRIALRVTPAYLGSGQMRVYIVDTPAWNAMVTPTGSIWVFRGLADDSSDDELAVALGHEVAHYTHEHTRRRMRTAMVIDLAAIASQIAINEIGNEAGYQIAEISQRLGLSAWGNGYSRSLEEQADRVGLRYAHEGGFDVSSAPVLWRRTLTREGQELRVMNFLMGTHPRPTERIRNIERQIEWNYRGGH